MGGGGGLKKLSVATSSKGFHSGCVFSSESDGNFTPTYGCGYTRLKRMRMTSSFQRRLQESGVNTTPPLQNLSKCGHFEGI